MTNLRILIVLCLAPLHLLAQTDDGITICRSSQIILSPSKPETVYQMKASKALRLNHVRLSAIEVSNPLKEPFVIKVTIESKSAAASVTTYSFFPVDRPDSFVLDLKEHQRSKEFTIKMRLESEAELGKDFHVLFKEPEWVKN